MFKDVLDLFELYVAYRILTVAATVLVVIALVVLPQWLLTYVMGTVMVVGMVAVVVGFPLAVIWVFCVVVNAARRRG